MSLATRINDLAVRIAQEIKSKAPLTYSVQQAGHGFEVGNTIKPTAAGWVKTQANSATSAGTVGIVSAVIDANTFRYIEGGVLPGSYIAGRVYFLSPSVAGEMVTKDDPEVWEIGQVREVLGTANTDGSALIVKIEQGDVINGEAIYDNYVDGISFNNSTRTLTLTRTGSLPDLSIVIPFPPEDLAYEFRDINKGVAQTYVLDMKASWPYTILGVVFESDGTLTGCSVKIGNTAVTGLSSLSIGTKSEATATGANSVVTGDVVTINTTSSYSGTPTLLRLKLKIQRT